MVLNSVPNLYSSSAAWFCFHKDDTALINAFTYTKTHAIFLTKHALEHIALIAGQMKSSYA